MPPRGWTSGVGALIVALGLLAGSAQAGINQWTRYGPAGGAIMALAIDPTRSSTLYAGGSGVYKSTDGGQQWTAMNTGLINTFVYALALDPRSSSTLYAGIIGGGVFKSTDGGQQWTAMNTSLTNPHVFALAIDPKIPTILYAGTDGGGIFAIEQEAPILP